MAKNTVMGRAVEHAPFSYMGGHPDYPQMLKGREVRLCVEEDGLTLVKKKPSGILSSEKVLLHIPREQLREVRDISRGIEDRGPVEDDDGTGERGSRSARRHSSCERPGLLDHKAVAVFGRCHGLLRTGGSRRLTVADPNGAGRADHHGRRQTQRAQPAADDRAPLSSLQPRPSLGHGGEHA